MARIYGALSERGGGERDKTCAAGAHFTTAFPSSTLGERRPECARARKHISPETSSSDHFRSLLCAHRPAASISHTQTRVITVRVTTAAPMNGVAEWISPLRFAKIGALFCLRIFILVKVSTRVRTMRRTMGKWESVRVIVAGEGRGEK